MRRGLPRVGVVERSTTRFLLRPPSVRGAARVIVTATAVVVIAGGASMRVFDHAEYSSIWVGMWWALQTVTTVGYGDVTPHDVAGRLVGALVMLEGTAFIAIVTAVITSTFVARATRDYEAARAEEQLSDRELMDKRFDDLERKLDVLATARGKPGT